MWAATNFWYFATRGVYRWNYFPLMWLYGIGYNPSTRTVFEDFTARAFTYPLVD